MKNQNNFLFILSQFAIQIIFIYFLISLCGDLLARKNVIKFLCCVSDQIGAVSLCEFIDPFSLK